MKKTKAIAVILIINLICSLFFSLNPSKVFAASQKIDNQISKIDDKKYPGIKIIRIGILKFYIRD